MIGIGIGINKSAVVPSTDIVLFSTDFPNASLPSGITVSDSVDVAIDNDSTYVENSSGYTGASGDYKIVFTDQLNGAATARFTKSGIVTTGKENVRLSFGCIDIVNSESGTVEYSLNGTDWTLLGVAFGSDTWSLRSLTLPSACENVSNLRLRWSWDQSGLGENKAIDDIKVLGDRIT